MNKKTTKKTRESEGIVKNALIWRFNGLFWA